MQETFWQKIEGIVGPATAAEFSGIGQQDTREALERFIIERSDEETTLLDAGCNTGVEGYRLMSSGYPGWYCGVDSNPKALGFALENLSGRRASFMLSDLSKITLPDKSFDIVLNKDVIEHAPGYEGILTELARITKKVLVLSMFIKMLDFGESIFPHPDGYHMNAYNKHDLLAFMKSIGMGDPKIIFENFSDQVLVFEKIG